MKNRLPLKQKDRAAVEEFQKKVFQLLGKSLFQLSLFGSKATGQDTPESDIDVLVLLNRPVAELKERILDAAFEVNLKHGVYISPRVLALSTFNDPVWSRTPFLRNLRENSLVL